MAKSIAKKTSHRGATRHITGAQRTLSVLKPHPNKATSWTVVVRGKGRLSKTEGGTSGKSYNGHSSEAQLRSARLARDADFFTCLAALNRMFVLANVLQETKVRGMRGGGKNAVMRSVAYLLNRDLRQKIYPVETPAARHRAPSYSRRLERRKLLREAAKSATAKLQPQVLSFSPLLSVETRPTPVPVTPAIEFRGEHFRDVARALNRIRTTRPDAARRFLTTYGVKPGDQSAALCYWGVAGVFEDESVLGENLFPMFDKPVCNTVLLLSVFVRLLAEINKLGIQLRNA